ncbi:hypothetical protein [Microbispora sp. NBC_01389]|uniref:hypothetical protein n=1 Tax=Microbispora sp. NBC_01389 TaxID=2903584 RepID=UPI0032502834
MGWWLVDADTLAESRFVAHLPAYRARLAGDPITAAPEGRPRTQLDRRLPHARPGRRG